MSYVIEHENWMKGHLKKRSGQRLDALKRGHGFGNQLFLEKVWWKLYGSFDGLHPEYEILDWRGYPFYADFMWSNSTVKFVIEIQDFGSHVQNIDREGYRKELKRGLFMKSLQYELVYIPLDDVRDNSKLLLSLLQIILSPFVLASSNQVAKYSKLEKDLMQLAIKHDRILRPIDAANRLERDERTIVKYMQQLIQKKKFRAIPSGNIGRIYKYEYIGSLTDPEIY